MNEAYMKAMEALERRISALEDQLRQVKSSRPAPQLPVQTGSTPIYADLYCQNGRNPDGTPILVPIEIDKYGTIQTEFLE